MIGEPQPCAINVELNRNGHLVAAVVEWIRSYIDLSPKGIVERFNGKEAHFKDVTRFGHFGVAERKREEDMTSYIPWEKTDIASMMRNIL